MHKMPLSASPLFSRKEPLFAFQTNRPSLHASARFGWLFSAQSTNYTVDDGELVITRISSVQRFAVFVLLNHGAENIKSVSFLVPEFVCVLYIDFKEWLALEKTVFCHGRARLVSRLKNLHEQVHFFRLNSRPWQKGDIFKKQYTLYWNFCAHHFCACG